MWCNTALISLLCVFAYSVAFGQNPDRHPPESYSKWGIKGSAGRIIAHAADIENTAGSVTSTVELEYSRRLLDSNVLSLCRCFPTTGLTFAFKDYNNEILGRGVHLAYFVQHHILPHAGVTPFIRGTGGIGYNDNPFHPEKNPDNQSYSLYFNAYLQIAAGAEFKISKSWLAALSVSFNHISNGGLSQPNRGINNPAAELSFYYAPKYNRPADVSDELFEKPLAGKKWIRRVYLLGTAASRDYGEKMRFPVYGAGFTAGRKLNNLNVITAGLEWHLDEGHRHRIKALHLEGNPNRAGFLLGHEFVMGHFVFSQQLGIYVFDEVKYHDPVYHRWGGKYVFDSGFSLGINLKVHRHIAEFADVRIGYNF